MLNSRITITPGGSVGAILGTYDIFGTATGAETVTVFDDTVVRLQSDFNRGGDTLRLRDVASDFQMVRQGSNVILTSVSDAITVTVPVGVAGIKVVFENSLGQLADERILLFNGTNVVLGTQTVGFTETQVSSGLNVAPVITSAASVTIDENAPITDLVYRVTATDADAGQTLTYSLAGTDAALFTINGSTGEVRLRQSANFEAKQSYAISVQASDGTATTTQAVTVSVRNLVDQLEIGGGGDGSISSVDGRGTLADLLDVNYRFLERVADANDVVISRFTANDVLSFDGPLSGYSFSSTGNDLIISQNADGVVSRIVLQGVVGSTQFVFDASTANTALNQALGTTNVNYLVVGAGSVNALPVVAIAIPDRSVTGGVAWSYQIPANTFNDPDGNTLTLSATLADGSALPTWLSFSATTGTFSGTPPLTFTGNVDLRVTASDGAASVNDNFRLTVSAAPAFTVLRTTLVNNVASDGLEVALLDGRRIALASSNQDITYSTLDADTLALRTNQTIVQQFGQVQPSMVQSGTRAFVAYASQPSGFHADEYGFFINSDGTKGSTLSLMDNWSGADWEPSLARFADGTMVMTFISERNGNYDIWAQNLDANGSKVGSLYLASGALPAHQMMYEGDLTAVIPGTKFFLQGWRTIPLSGADANGPRSISMSLVNATTGTVVQTATVASGLAAFPLTSSESMSINEAGNGLIFYQSGGALFYRSFSASTSAFTLGTAQSAALPAGGLVNVDVASAVLPNGNIAAAVSGTNGSRQYVFLLDINPANGTVGNAVTLLDQSISGISGLSRTDAFTSETGWRLPIDISILGSEIVVAYRDAAKGGIGVTSLTFSAPVSNSLPVVANPIPDRTVAEDAAWSYQVPANTFSDPDGNPLMLTAMLADGSALPTWLSFNASTRTFSGVPPLNFTGIIDLRVTASDGSASINDAFSLTVTPVNDAPVVSAPIADQSVAGGAPWLFTLPVETFTDVDSAALMLTATLASGATLPAWLSFNGTTRTFSGTLPLELTGAIDLRVTASDGSASVNDAFKLTATPAKLYFLFNVSNGVLFWVTSDIIPSAGTRILEPAQTGLDSRLTIFPDGSVTITDVRGVSFIFNVGYGEDLTFVRNLSNQPNFAEFPNTFNPNSPVNPVIKSNGGGDSANISVLENVTAVTQVLATDFNRGDQLIYSIIGGADQSRFDINSATGMLSFKTAPNFEMPTDAGSNNVYNVEVQASDGTLFDRMTLSINVLNVSEPGG